MMSAFEPAQKPQITSIGLSRIALALSVFAGAAVATVALCYLLVLIAEIGEPKRRQMYDQAQLCLPAR